MLGIGITNTELSKLLKSKGANVTVCDKKSRDELGTVCDEMETLGIKLSTGEKYLDALKTADIIFRTPGFYYNSPFLLKARKEGKVVTSEMEIFFEVCPCPIYAVTGSDGKTTTTSLIAKFLERQGETVHLGGNIGRALLADIENIKDSDVAVVELSSFQLISMRQSPNVAVFTNISPNHLDVHKDMNEYILAKCNIFMHQNAFSTTVLNYDNELTRNLSDMARGKLVYFSRKKTPAYGAYLDKDSFICFAQNGQAEKLFHADEICIPGIHNVENYLAAITAVYPKVNVENLRKVANTFNGVEHRIEFTAEHNGVRWYNNSIATTPSRTIACLNSFDQKMIIIAGGRDKNLEYEPLAPLLIEKVKTLILMGETAKIIEKAVRSHKDFNENEMLIINVEDMEQAVKTAYENAKTGDIVALSPSSSSYDKYKNFEERGKHFKSLVKTVLG